MKTIMTRCICIVFVSVFATMGCENHSKEQESTGQYQSEVMLKLFDIKTPNDLIVQIPEANASCKINTIVDKDTLHFVEGKYAYGDVRGVVYIAYNKIVALENESSFIIPFSVSNQGSGIFRYVGLFTLNVKDGSIKHLDSKFLGDRIKLESIAYDGNEHIKVKMKVHAKGQGFAELPTEEKEIDIDIAGQKFR